MGNKDDSVVKDISFIIYKTVQSKIYKHEWNKCSRVCYGLIVEISLLIVSELLRSKIFSYGV